MNIVKSFLITLLFFVFCFSMYSFFTIRVNKNIALSSVSEAFSQSEPSIQDGDIPVKNWNIADVQLTANSSMSMATNLVDVKNDKVLFAKNEKTQLPIASLTKLMTAIMVIDNYDLLDSVIIHEEPENSESKEVSLGDIQSVNNLLHIMLIASNNEAALALSEKVGEKEFIWLMNEKAKYLGLQNTHFADPTGLSVNNVSTAEDLSKLAMYILKNYPKIIQVSEMKEIELPGFGKIENTNKLLGKIPGIIIGKTGFTIDAKECLLLVLYNQKAKNYLVNVILSSDDRFKDMQSLINWVNNAWSWQKIQHTSP